MKVTTTVVSGGPVGETAVGGYVSKVSNPGLLTTLFGGPASSSCPGLSLLGIFTGLAYNTPPGNNAIFCNPLFGETDFAG